MTINWELVNSLFWGGLWTGILGFILVLVLLTVISILTANYKVGWVVTLNALLIPVLLTTKFAFITFAVMGVLKFIKTIIII